jgi:hypothetical protein
MTVEALRNTVGGLHRTELVGSRKELEHCIEVKEDCKKMLLGSGTPVEQVVSRKEQVGCIEEQVGCIQEQEDCIQERRGETFLGPHTVEELGKMVQLHRKEQQAGHRKLGPIDDDDHDAEPVEHHKLELLLGHHELRRHRECE